MEGCMETTQRHQLDGYEYHLGAYITDEGKFRGMILVTAHAGNAILPNVKIPTPTTFKSDRAARIEASALAYQLIHTGAISVLVPRDDDQICPPVPEPSH